LNSRRSTTPYSDEYDLLISDEDQAAIQEASNGLLQFDEVNLLVQKHASSQDVEVTPRLLSELNRLAMSGIRRSAGKFRQIAIRIENSPHVPPPFEQVPELVDEMCDYVRSNWRTDKGDLADAMHLSAYLMWRLNWIHPFRDGNGRTSRAISYLALSVRYGKLLPGTPTIADRIVENRQPYYDALDLADAAWVSGRVDVSAMEALLEKLLRLQLLAATSPSA
jgi:Fic family protein